MTELINKVKRKIEVKLGLNFEKKVLKFFQDKKGIEIGGPSPIFSEQLPIYPVLAGLDGCNFSSKTVWEGEIQHGLNYSFYKNKKGFQYISEASDLKEVPAEKYDFLLASHCLEHCANPLKTVKEWRRVIKKGGFMLLILPNKECTFDHNRSITSFEHLQEDYNNNVDETDLTHLNEIISLHDLSLDAPAGDWNNFKERSLRNFENRCLHHHVYDFNLLERIVSYCGMVVQLKGLVGQLNQVVLAVKK